MTTTQFNLDLHVAERSLTSSVEFSKHQNELDIQERKNSRPWDETAGFGEWEQAPGYEQPPLVVQTTPQSKTAKPIFLFENRYDHKGMKQYESQGWLNASKVAQARGMNVDNYISKACFHLNKTTNVIIFNLSILMNKTLGQIFNACINNKTVLVRYGKLTFRNLKINTPEYQQLADLFQESKMAYFAQLDRQRLIVNEEMKLFSPLDYVNNKTIKIRQLDKSRVVIADLLAEIWELPQAVTENDYQVLLETINVYFKAQIPSTRVYTLAHEQMDNESVDDYESRKQNGDYLMSRIESLPYELQQQLLPLVTFEYGSVEFIGNEDMLDMEYYGE